MILRNLIIGLFYIFTLTSCAQNTVLLGPAYTLATSGSIYQASLTYGGNEVITKATGKSAAQNFKEVLTPKKEDSNFEKLVKKNIIETRKKLNFSNQ